MLVDVFLVICFGDIAASVYADHSLLLKKGAAAFEPSNMDYRSNHNFEILKKIKIIQSGEIKKMYLNFK